MVQSRWKRAGLAVIFLVVAIQLVPVDRSNPPGEVRMTVAPEVRAVLEQSCFDCHSNQTVWPWYSRVAPVSWLVAHDVEEGRGKLDFTTWDDLEPRKQDKIRQEVWEETSAGEMPLWFYLPAHPQAKLTAEDLATLRGWSGTDAGEAAGAEH